MFYWFSEVVGRLVSELRANDLMDEGYVGVVVDQDGSWSPVKARP